MNRTHAPLIGLSVYNDEDKYHYFPNDYINAVRTAGGIPVLLPPDETDSVSLINGLDGLILTGGGDINPKFYNGSDHPDVYWINDLQDKTEFSLAEQALQLQKPVLATCRGMQIINVLFGGTLCSHLPEVYGETTLHRHDEDKCIDHQIELKQDSNLAKLLQVSRFTAKSWHHQAIDKLAENFKAIGFAPDGVIEAIESNEYPNLIAVQWHPEIGASSDPVQQRLFDMWVENYCCNISS